MSTPPPSKAKEEASRTLLTHGMTLFEIARAYWKGSYREVPTWTILVTLLSLGYVISPFDIVPEIALGPLGVIDDVLVLGLAMKLINGEIERYTKWKTTGSSSNAAGMGNGKVLDV
jgi:uncharacterized membrane protein YkvA (DUF1232 family)